MNLLGFLRFLQTVDRRVLYGLLLLTVTLPFLLRPHLNVEVSDSTRELYDKVESLQPGDFVMMGIDWSASTRGENMAQTRILMQHLMRKKLRFAFLALDPQGRELTQRMAENFSKTYGYVEGRDWVDWGYIPSAAQVNYVLGLAKDVVSTVKSDFHHHNIATLPVMAGIRTARDIKLFLDISPTNSYNAYIAYFAGPNKIPMGLAPTAVMAPEAFVYLDSRQIIGLLQGVQGAAEYEKLMGISDKATLALPALSFAHLLLILLIVMGNVAMILERRQRARTAGEGR